MSKRPGSALPGRLAKVSRRKAVELPNDCKLLKLPLEIRYRIYAYLIYPGLPGPRSALTVTHTRLREEVHHWLAGQKLTIHVGAWQDQRFTVPAWYERVLQRATNIEFDLSCLPKYPCHPTVELLCRLWRSECHLKQVKYTVLDKNTTPRKCLYYTGDNSNFPDTLPSLSKKLLCKWLLHPIDLILAKREIQPLYTSLEWEQLTSRSMTRSYLETHYRNDEAAAMLFESFTEQTFTPSDDCSWITLVDAVRHGYQAVVKVLLESITVDLSKATTSGRTLLMEAICSENLHTTDVLLEGLGPSAIEDELNRQDDKSCTALWHAMWGQETAVRYLLERCADPNIADHGGLTPLLHAVQRGEIKCVKVLCGSDRVNTSARDLAGRTVLHIGAEEGHVECFNFLVQRKGVGINDVDDIGKTALFYAAQHERVALVKNILNSHRASIDVRDKLGRTPLSYAAGSNSHGTTALLLEAGASCDSKDDLGNTPLFHAVKAGHFATTVRLVKHTRDGNPALALAGQMGQTKIEEKLLNMKDNLNWEDDRLQKLLLQSARDGRDCMVRPILHMHKVKPDVRGVDGRTPLSYAAETGHINIIRILSREGADRDLRDKQGYSPVYYAARHGNETHKCILKDWVSRASSYSRRKKPLSD